MYSHVVQTLLLFISYALPLARPTTTTAAKLLTCRWNHVRHTLIHLCGSSVARPCVLSSVRVFRRQRLLARAFALTALAFGIHSVEVELPVPHSLLHASDHAFPEGELLVTPLHPRCARTVKACDKDTQSESEGKTKNKTLNGRTRANAESITPMPFYLSLSCGEKYIVKTIGTRMSLYRLRTLDEILYTFTSSSYHSQYLSLSLPPYRLLPNLS